MADKLNWFFKQRVSFTEMREANDKLEASDHAILTDLFTAVNGFLTTSVSVVETTGPSQSIDVGAILGYDNLGQRVEEAAQTFAGFVGQNPGGSATQARLYVKFIRDEGNPRVDGLGNTIQFDQDEGAELQFDLGTPGGGPPTLRTDESILIADINLPATDGNILNADITVTAQNLKSSFPVERLSNLSDADTKMDGFRGEVKMLTDRTTPTTQIDVEFCRVLDNSNTRILAPANNLVIDADSGTFGELALDVGPIISAQGAGWFYVYAIGATPLAPADTYMMSVALPPSFGGPGPSFANTDAAMDQYRLIGAVYWDGVAFVNFRQIDNEVYYEEEELVASGFATALALVSCATRIPPIAERGIFAAYTQQAIAGGFTTWFGDAGQSGAALTTIRFRAVTSTSTMSYDTGEFRLHVSGTQQVYAARNSNINASELYARGFVLDNKEG
jgi:hypothetical protein